MEAIHEAAVFRGWWGRSVVGMAILAKDGRFLRANPAVCNFLEYAEPELAKRSFQAVIHPDDVDDYVALAHDVATGESGAFDLVTQFVRKRGALEWANVRVSGICSDGGDFVALLVQISPAHPDGPTPAKEERGSNEFVKWATKYKAHIVAVASLAAAVAHEIFNKGGK